MKIISYLNVFIAYTKCIQFVSIDLNETTLLKYGAAWYATMNDGFCDVLNNLCQWHNVFPLTKCKIWWAVKICLCWRLFWSDIGFKDKGYNIWTNYYFKGSFRYVTVWVINKIYVSVITMLQSVSYPEVICSRVPFLKKNQTIKATAVINHLPALFINLKYLHWQHSTCFIENIIILPVKMFILTLCVCAGTQFTLKYFKISLLLLMAY